VKGEYKLQPVSVLKGDVIPSTLDLSGQKSNLVLNQEENIFCKELIEHVKFV
jgi:hypothetical protein